MQSVSPNRTDGACFPGKQPSAVVHLVHKESSMRQSLAGFLESRSIRVLSFGSAREYLGHRRCQTTACLLIDLHLPDVSGLDLQKQLSGDSVPPIIFISDNDDTRCTVRALKAGAMEFFAQPIDHNELLLAIDLAFSEDYLARERKAYLANLRQRLSSLSPRERDVFPRIVSGLRNKQVAWELRISEVTVQVHRGQIMRKMAASSFAELVRMAGQLNVA